QRGEFQVLPSCHPVQKRRPFGLMVRIKYRFLCSLCELLFRVLSSRAFVELTASTGGREERILKQRDRKDLKEGSSRFCRVIARYASDGHLVSRSGSSSSSLGPP